MSELAQKSREAMKAKIARLIDPTPGKVDSSDYGPEETDMHADRKTGARPRNPRAYKRGGAVAEGDKPKPNAGKVQRKGRKAEWSEEAKSAASARGPVKNETGRRAYSGDESYPVDKKGRRAPEYRPSTPVEGLARKLQKEGPSRGSSSPSQWEAMMEAMPRRRGYSAPSSGGRKITSEPEYAKGGEVKGRNFRDQMRDAALKKGSANGPGGSHYKRRPGASQDVVATNNGEKSLWGKTGKWNIEHGGAAFPEWKEKAGPIPRKSGGRTKHPDAAEDRALVKSMVKPECRTARKDGGANWIAEATKHKGALHKALGVPAGEKIPAKKMAKAEHSDNPHVRKMANLAKTLKGMHDSDGGRVERAAGGRTKGKTNVNVIIATGPQQPQGGMPGAMPPIGAAPMGPPPMPAPNAAMPGTSPMPGGPPPAGMPPMPRKRGGRTGAGENMATKMGKYPIETGSGGGRARLDKKDAY